MTALQEYQRLESTGLWRDRPDGQRREVIVSFGDATLVIAEARSIRPLAHWSLPAIVRLGDEAGRTRFAPGPDADEELELEDEAMIAAISKVHRLIEARRPHPGRLRSLLLGGALALVLAVGLIFVPGQMVRHTAAALPFAKRQDIGRAALSDLVRLTGAPCDAAEGEEALLRLHDRLLGPEGEVLVLPDGFDRSEVLPGGMILLSRKMIEGADDPNIVAGEILAADLRHAAADPMVPTLRYAGLAATFNLLTTGDLPKAALTGYGEELLRSAPAEIGDRALLDRFAAAGIPSSAYAYSIDQTGESVLGLIEADPFRTQPPPGPVIADADWVAIQGICAG